MHESNKPYKEIQKHSNGTGLNNTFKLQKEIMKDSFTKSLKSQKDLEMKHKIIDELVKAKQNLQVKYDQLDNQFLTVDELNKGLNCKLTQANTDLKTLKTDSEASQKQVKEQLETCKTHINSLVNILTDLFEYILSK
jgi:peptidoglycan hydrolase CwlO-like protein